jgi:hypothetical protein
MQPVTVEIVTYAPSEFFHCLHCELVWRESGIGPRIHAEQRASALPADLSAEYHDLGRWAEDLVERFGDRVRLRVVDAVSLEGFYKILRHRLGRLPAAIVNGRKTYAAPDLDRVTAAIEREIGVPIHGKEAVP